MRLRSAKPAIVAIAGSCRLRWSARRADPCLGSTGSRPRPTWPAASERGPFRALVPGVEITIPPDRQEEETFSTHDIVEILQGIPGLDWQPKLSPDTHTLQADGHRHTVFRRDIWCLEFTFKPVRMIWVDVPQPTARCSGS